jgi:UDPglucose 6-dehydrogenase
MGEYNIGIVGYGFLGTAVVHGFSLHANIKIYDKYKIGFDTLEDTVNNSEFLFFCIPTPMYDDDGSQDLSILEGAVQDVHAHVPAGSNKIAIIKSTVLPGTNKMFQKKYPNLKFVSNPEFLTARSNRLDFICAARNILGGEEEPVNRVEALYRHRFGNAMPIYKTSWKAAEMVKYTANCFFAVKVSYFNFIYDMCQKLGLDYNEIKDMVLADGRIGRSHCDVGGGSGVSDGKRQFGGSCFPKDINALIDFAKELGLDPKLLMASWEQNVDGRPEKDWEQLPGVVSKRKW